MSRMVLMAMTAVATKTTPAGQPIRTGKMGSPSLPQRLIQAFRTGTLTV